MKTTKTEVRMSESDQRILEELCRFFEKNKSEMIRDSLFCRHLLVQHLVDEYETYADYDKDRDGYNQRQLKKQLSSNP